MTTPMRCLFRHRWVTVERIGRVITQQCHCGKTRVRVR